MSCLLACIFALGAAANEPIEADQSAVRTGRQLDGDQSISRSQSDPLITHPVTDPRLSQTLVDEFLTAEGRDPFNLLVRLDETGEPISQGGHVFWRSLELGHKNYFLYGASWDELYQFASPLDAVLLGKVEVAKSVRAYFASPRYVNLMVAPTSVFESWVLNAEVGFIGPNGLVAYFEDISTSGVMASFAGGPVLVERIVSAAGLGTVTLRATLFYVGGPYSQSGTLWIELLNATGGVPYVFGQFSGLLMDTNGPAVTLPLAGLTHSPDHRLIALSEGEWDPYGCPGLYELTILPGVVAAERLATVANDSIHAIEFSPDGTLWGAGDALYIIDPHTGEDTLIATTGLPPIVDLDYALDQTLYGVTLGRDEPSQLVDLTPDGRPISAAVLEPAGPYWGFARRPYEDWARHLSP